MVAVDALGRRSERRSLPRSVKRGSRRGGVSARVPASGTSCSLRWFPPVALNWYLPDHAKARGGLFWGQAGKYRTHARLRDESRQATLGGAIQLYRAGGVGDFTILRDPLPQKQCTRPTQPRAKPSFSLRKLDEGHSPAYRPSPARVFGFAMFRYACATSSHHEPRSSRSVALRRPSRRGTSDRKTSNKPARPSQARAW